MADSPLERAEVSDAPDVARELGARRAAGTVRWPVPVTDLVDPRPAYFRRFFAVPLPPERARHRLEGSLRHARWVRRLGPLDHVEVRVQRGSLVGVIDLLGEEGPVELKTTERPPPEGRWVEDRGTYFDQLGLYAALTGLPIGWLVAVDTSGPVSPASVHVRRCRFRALPEILEEAEARAERLRRAIRARDPAPLPRCLWFGPRCPFRAAQACDCRGDEPLDDRWVRDRIVEVARDPEEELHWGREVAVAERERSTVVRSFSELVYPRRAYFERTDPAAAEGARPPDPASQEAYRALAVAVDSGPPGERDQRASEGGEPPGAVARFRGLPYLLKTRRGAPPPSSGPPGPLPSHYRDELALRCAAVGASEGWIFLDYLGARSPGDRLRVWRVRFPEPSAWAGELRRRTTALADALARDDPSGLTPCPSWRYAECAYRASCRCGENAS